MSIKYFYLGLHLLFSRCSGRSSSLHDVHVLLGGEAAVDELLVAGLLTLSLAASSTSVATTSATAAASVMVSVSMVVVAVSRTPLFIMMPLKKGKITRSIYLCYHELKDKSALFQEFSLHL